MTISRDEVISVLGPVDDEVVAAVIATGASVEELVQARTWLAADEALIAEGRPLPSGRVAELLDLLSEDDEGAEDGVAPADEIGPHQE